MSIFKNNKSLSNNIDRILNTAVEHDKFLKRRKSTVENHKNRAINNNEIFPEMDDSHLEANNKYADRDVFM